MQCYNIGRNDDISYWDLDSCDLMLVLRAFCYQQCLREYQKSENDSRRWTTISSAGSQALTKISVWGESFTWTAGHPKEEELKPLLHTYDEMAANAYDRALELFHDEQAQNKKESELSKGPPPKPDVFQIIKDNASSDPACAKLWAHVNHVPDWVDYDQLARGQDIFFRYALANMVGLGFQSLFVGMAAARVVEVLVRTGGFSPAASQRRGFETVQWNLEIMRDIASLKPGGDGWVSTIRVRLLHSAVRSKIMAMAKAKPEYFNIPEYGIPINDSDSAGTIGTFVSAPIWYSLPRQKIRLRKQEIEDYVALWRYIAYLMGAPEHFFSTPEKAQKYYESSMYYEFDPSENSKVLANNILNAFSKQSALKLPMGFVNAIARKLAGNELCNELEVGNANVVWRGLWYTNMVVYKCIAYMCRSVPWLDKRNIKIMKNFSWKLVVEGKHGLKGEKSTFPMKYKPSYNLTKAE